MYVFVELLGGIALLLWGLRMVRTGVMRAYGASLNRLAGKSEDKVLPAFLSGLFAAAMLQSSTATAMIAASFSARAVISVTGAFYIILGADIGTAIAVLLASQKIIWLAPALISIGVFGFLSTENSKRRSIFRAFIGIGLILSSLALIGQIGNGLFQSPEAKTVLGLLLQQPFLLALFAIFLTYLAHSSLAVLLLTIGFVTSGFIDVASALYLVIGANIGSGLLPVLANLKAPRLARIPVTTNLILRGMVAVVFFFAVPQALEQLALFYDFANGIIPAVFHIVLNVTVVLVGLLLSRPLLRFASSLVPRDENDFKKVEPKYLDDSQILKPGIALACAKREALHLAEISQVMLSNVYLVLKTSDQNLLESIVAKDDDVDRLFDAIKLYLAKTMQSELTEDESHQAQEILSFTANMEHIGDIVESGLMDIARKKIKQQLVFSDEGFAEIRALHQLVVSSFELAINTFVSGDPELARELYDAKNEMRDQERISIAAHYARIGKGQVESISTSSLHIDFIRDLKRINSHLTSIAYPVLKASGEVPKTDWKRKID